jgi:hypothetical protein
METTISTSKKTTTEISKAKLAAMVDSGVKKEQIAECFGLNMAQTTKLLKSAGLKIRNFHTPAFTLVD